MRSAPMYEFIIRRDFYGVVAINSGTIALSPSNKPIFWIFRNVEIKQYKLRLMG